MPVYPPNHRPEGLCHENPSHHLSSPYHHGRRSARSPLHDAAREGDVEAIQRLLAAGADPNAKAAYLGDTPLHTAALMGHADAIAALLKGGADPNANAANDADGDTPLHWAVGEGHAEVIHILEKASE